MAKTHTPGPIDADVHESVRGLRDLSERHEIRKPDGSLDKLLYTVSRDNFLSLSPACEGRGSARSNKAWVFGSPGSASALIQSLTGGQPTASVWAAYQRIKASARFDEVADATIQRRRRRVFSDNGCEADGARWLAGDPEHWASMRRVGRVQSITLGMQLGLSCGNGEDDFAENTATCVVLAESLISAGYAVRLVVMNTSYNLISGASETGWIVNAVDFGQPIDEAAILSWGTPGVCRWHAFEYAHALFSGDGRVSSTYGYCYETSAAMLKLAGIDLLVAKQWDKEKGEQKDYLSRLRDKAAAIIASGESNGGAP